MSIRIGLGTGDFIFSGVDSFWRWVSFCEENGVDSLWQSDRLISSEPQLESMSVMAALAGATKRIKFGMNVVVLPYRDPLVLAKQCATIDYLSKGRLLPAFGVGSLGDPVLSATGRPTIERGRRANEMITILSRLWQEKSVTFKGEFFQYSNVQISPKPVQNPLPLWIGGSSAAAIRRTASLGTGWLGGFITPERTREVIADIKRQLKENGRHIDPDHYGMGIRFRFGSYNDTPVTRFVDIMKARRLPNFDLNTCLAVGSKKDIVSILQRYVEAGISKFVATPLIENERELFYQTETLINEILPVLESGKS